MKQARREAGLTQVDVSRLLRKPQSFVSYIERGQRRVDFVELLLLSELYKKPISFFIPKR